MPVNDTAKNVLGTIGSFHPAPPPGWTFDTVAGTVNRNYMLDGPGPSPGIQVMARKVDGGSIALAHVSILLFT